MSEGCDHNSLPLLFSAHSRWSRRRRPVAVESRLVSRRLPHDAIHRVQRRSRHVPLLRQQVQFLADDDQLWRPVQYSALTDPEGRQSAVARQSLQRVYEGSTAWQLPAAVDTSDSVGLQLTSPASARQTSRRATALNEHSHGEQNLGWAGKGKSTSTKIIV